MAAPFISRDDLGDHLGGIDLSTDASALQAVDAACDWVRDITGQVLNYVEDEVVLMDGTGTDALLLPQLPVVEVTDVIVGDYADQSNYRWTLHDDGVLMWEWLVEGSSIAPTRARWPIGRNNVEITYTHGYTDATFPRSLRMVALEIAARFYRQPGGAVFEQLGQHAVRWDSSPGDLPAGFDRILRKHTFKRQPSRVVVGS